MELVLQQIANGLSLGMAYALVALGLTLVFGVLHIVNFAHGEFYMLGALVAALAVKSLGVPYLATLPFAAILVAGVAYAVDRIAVLPLKKEKGGDRIVLVSTYAIAIILVESVLATLGPTPVGVSGIGGRIEIGPVVVTQQRLFMFMAGAVLIAGLYWVLKHTDFGRSLRAVAQSDEAARVVGLPVDRIQTKTFVLAGCVAGVAGALITPIVTYSPTMGLHAAIHAFVVVVIGTMGSIPGAVICGLLLGVIESVLSIFVSQDVATAIIYSLLVAMLLVRPQGLFGGTAQ